MDSRPLRPLARAQSQFTQERRQPSPPPGQKATRGPLGAHSSAQQGLQTQDWVPEPQQRRHPSRHWSVSIDERRRLAMLGSPERPYAARTPSKAREILQMVAELVSEDVDKDVLLPQLPRCGVH